MAKNEKGMCTHVCFLLVLWHLWLSAPDKAVSRHSLCGASTGTLELTSGRWKYLVTEAVLVQVAFEGGLSCHLLLQSLVHCFVELHQRKCPW